MCREVVGIVDEINAGTGISRRRVRLARLLSRLGVVAIVLFLGRVLVGLRVDPDS